MTDFFINYSDISRYLIGQASMFIVLESVIGVVLSLMINDVFTYFFCSATAMTGVLFITNLLAGNRGDGL